MQLLLDGQDTADSTPVRTAGNGGCCTDQLDAPAAPESNRQIATVIHPTTTTGNLNPPSRRAARADEPR